MGRYVLRDFESVKPPNRTSFRFLADHSPFCVKSRSLWRRSFVNLLAVVYREIMQCGEFKEKSNKYA